MGLIAMGVGIHRLLLVLLGLLVEDLCICEKVGGKRFSERTF